MTFNEILKEFDEQFTFTDNWGTFVGWYEQNDGTKGYYTNDKTKSFLKQSFIKYLQSEVEFLDKKKNRFNEDTETLANAGYSIALDDISLRLQEQLKELE